LKNQRLLGKEDTIAGPIQVLIVDDHALQRSGVRAILEADGGFKVCAEAGDAESAVRLACHHLPDICLLDIDMPGNGISAASLISHKVPGAAIIMLTVSRNDGDLFDALKAGALGYLPKDTAVERLPEALRGALRGEAALPRVLVTRVIDEFQERGRRRTKSPLDSRGVRLTSREWEVMDLLVEGMRTDEIARRLFVGAVTVRSHVAAILKKLKVPDRQEAVRLFTNA
jgi:DNA-binding NarL/FixJ family response regulator